MEFGLETNDLGGDSMGDKIPKKNDKKKPKTDKVKKPKKKYLWRTNTFEKLLLGNQQKFFFPVLLAEKSNMEWKRQLIPGQKMMQSTYWFLIIFFL